MVRTHRHRRGAFTLIELLVVISIIVLLISILLPTLRRTREVSRRTICGSNFHQMYLGIAAFTDTNNGWMFQHWNSVNAPDTSVYWGPEIGSDPADWYHISWERREAQPNATSNGASTNGVDWPWDNLGGPRGSKGFFPALYPNYIPDGRIFNCPSAYYYPWSDMGYYTGWEVATRFETYMGRYLNAEPGWDTYGNFWSPFVGNVYGRINRPNDKFGHGVWSSYYVQGYYPYSPDYQSSVGALLWDTGSYGFWLGATGSVTMGVHRVGGHELFVDGHVAWKSYPWMEGVEW